MLKWVVDAYELLDSPTVTGERVGEWVRSACGADGDISIESTTITGEKGSTDFVKFIIPGSRGKTAAGDAPTLGIIGRLGGIGARPERIGYVSDGDGAVAAVACAAKLGAMKQAGDRLPGDVIIATHICPNAPTKPHDPVPFMDSPVDMGTMNAHEVDPAMDAILSIDTTKGNTVINTRGFAISPTVKEGWILRIAPDLLEIMGWSTGRLPAVLPLATQDITPYGNGVHHVNSILQPCVATSAPVVGVAITAEVPVPGCGTGASREVDIEEAARFCLEVAKSFGENACSFYNRQEFETLTALYGSMTHLSTNPRNDG